MWGETKMTYLTKICLGVFFFTSLCATLCHAGMATLSEDEMGEVVAQEGICDVRIPETCVTDTELAQTMAKKTETIEINAETLTTNPNLAILSGLISPINPNMLSVEMVKNPYAESVTVTPNKESIIPTPMP